MPVPKEGAAPLILAFILLSTLVIWRMWPERRGFMIDERTIPYRKGERVTRVRIGKQ